MAPFPTHIRRLIAVAGVALLALGSALVAQGPGAQAPPQGPVNASDDPILRAFSFRAIGPAVMGGRVNDIEG